MMQKQILLYTLFFFFALISCTNNKKKSINDTFSEKIILKESATFIDGDDLAQIEGICCNDQNIIVLDYHSGYSFTLFDVDSCKLVGRFGAIGQGPDELALGTYGQIEKDNFYLFYDQTGFIGKYAISSLNKDINTTPRQMVRYQIIDAQLSQAIPINDSLFIGAGTYMSKFQFVLFDKYSNVLDYNVEIYNASEKTFNKYHKFLSNQGVLRKRLNQDQFVYSLNFSSNIDFLELKENKIQLIKSLRLHNPNYQPISDNNLNRVLPSDNNIIGYIDLCATEKYVYALHTDKKLFTNNIGNDYNSKTVLVFDWKGYPVKKIELNQNAFYICVNESAEKLYAAVIDSSSSEWVIVSYDIRDL